MGASKGRFVPKGQLPPSGGRVKAAAEDPTSEEPPSVPSRDPREAVAWLRAAAEGRASPEEERRVKRTLSEVRGRQWSEAQSSAFRPRLLCALGKAGGSRASIPGAGKVRGGAPVNAHRSTLQELEARI